MSSYDSDPSTLAPSSSRRSWQEVDLYSITELNYLAASGIIEQIVEEPAWLPSRTPTKAEKARWEPVDLSNTSKFNYFIPKLGYLWGGLSSSGAEDVRSPRTDIARLKLNYLLNPPKKKKKGEWRNEAATEHDDEEEMEELLRFFIERYNVETNNRRDVVPKAMPPPPGPLELAHNPRGPRACQCRRCQCCRSTGLSPVESGTESGTESEPKKKSHDSWTQAPEFPMPEFDMPSRRPPRPDAEAYAA